MGYYIYAIRKDLTDRLDQFPPREMGQGRNHRIGPYTDANWQNGIAIGTNAERWSFALPSSLTSALRPGDVLLFSDGIERRVVDIDRTNVRTEPTIGVTAGTDSTGISFSLVNRKLLLQNPWERVLHRSQLWRIPSAWGRSMERLAGNLSAVGTAFRLRATVDVEPDTSFLTDFHSTGPDPYWVFELSEPVAPEQAGLLDMMIDCNGTKVNPLVQVFWRSSETGFSEEASLRFEASFIRNLVPLDSSPFWRLPQDIVEIRIDLANPSECPRVRLQEIRLFKRISSEVN